MVKSTDEITSQLTNKKSNSIVTDKKQEHKTLLFALFLVFLLIVFAVSITYAFFARNVTQTGDDPNTKIETALLDVDFTTSQYITNTNAQLIYDEDAADLADRTIFSVTRSKANTVKNVYYTLSLVDINISDNLKSPYFKWSLYETTDITSTTEPLNEGTFEIVENNTISLYETKIPLAQTAVDDFVLIIWLSNDDEVNQTELLEGTISAKVEVTAVNS